MSEKVILACKNLRLHLEKAQETMHTQIPVIELDTSLHKDPPLMREKIIEEISRIPHQFDTVLAAMGFCGGSWKNIRCDRTVVIPRNDDCISMLLTTNDVPKTNLKAVGCMYLSDNRDREMTIPGIREHLLERYGEKRGTRLFDLYFRNYHRVCIIDTGTYDSYGPEFLEFARKSADLIHGDVVHVPGSNKILEKLVSGQWDSQFYILRPGETLTEDDFI